MRLQLVENEGTTKASVNDILDYASFAAQHRRPTDTNELQVFEKFHAARMLVATGFDTFLNAQVVSERDDKPIKVDAAAVDPQTGNITLVFCESSTPSESLWPALQFVTKSNNANVIVLSSEGLAEETLRTQVPGALETGKVSLETIGWFEDNLENTLQETLHMLELLVNETRIRMLAPLFQKSTAKKEYRERINPKLVYSNLNSLSEAGLVDEPLQGTYQLSQFGKTMLGEFITFLEKTRRILDESKQR
jgi:hypothetical protein